MSILLLVLLGWLALCVPASAVLLALGRAASIGDEQLPFRVAVAPAGDVATYGARRVDACPACAIIVVADADGDCPRCGGATVATRRIGARAASAA